MEGKVQFLLPVCFFPLSPLPLNYFHTDREHSTFWHFWSTNMWVFFPQQAIACDTSWVSYNLTQAQHRYSIRSHTSRKSAPLLSPLHCPPQHTSDASKSPGCHLCFWPAGFRLGFPNPFLVHTKVYTQLVYIVLLLSPEKKKNLNWKSQILNVSSGNLVSHPTKPHISCN